VCGQKSASDEIASVLTDLVLRLLEKYVSELTKPFRTDTKVLQIEDFFR
jgi:hypothetical protein